MPAEPADFDPSQETPFQYNCRVHPELMARLARLRSLAKDQSQASSETPT